MRHLGALQGERAAKKFGDYLLSIGIENEVEPGEGGDWDVWVVPEDEVEKAAELLEEFVANPAAPRYERARAQAEARRAQARKDEAAARKRQVNVAERMHARQGAAPVTLALIAVSVVVALATGLGRIDERVLPLFISESAERLSEIRSGEVWRLITPVFLHFGILHIAFNMLWLNDLGGMVERRGGSARLLAFVLAVGVLSNLAQFYAVDHSFGGMSGVVYGLLAYVWLRGRLQPSSGLHVSGGTMTMMIVWYFMCLVGIIPNIANAAHTAGLALGAGWGFATAKARRIR